MTFNPERGCGRKRKDSFYLEGGSSSSGILALWTWLLDDGGVEEENILYWAPPPRQIVEFRPLDSIATREIYRMDDPPLPDDYDNFDFRRLLHQVPRIGLLDHVGQDNYSAASFVREIREHGSSRKTTAQFAKKVGEFLGKFGACPLLFTHSRIPVFRTAEVRETAWQLTKECLGMVMVDSGSFVPTWQEDDFGMLAAYYNGWRSSMIHILGLVDKLDMNWQAHAGLPLFQEAKKFFDGLDWVERPFGGTWVTYVTYTGEATNETEKIPGLRYLDLDADEIVGHSASWLED